MRPMRSIKQHATQPKETHKNLNLNRNRNKSEICEVQLATKTASKRLVQLSHCGTFEVFSADRCTADRDGFACVLTCRHSSIQSTHYLAWPRQKGDKTVKRAEGSAKSGCVEYFP